MKKFLLILLVFVLLLFVAGLFFINYKSADYISSFLTKNLNTEVKIEGVSVGFESIEVIGLKIANPKNSTLKNAFSADSIEIDFNFSSLFKDTIIIEEIAIDNAKIGIDFYNATGTENNWKTILKNIPSSDQSQESSSDGKTKPQKQFIINKLILTDTQVEAQHKLFGPYSVLIPLKEEIVFNNLTSQNAVDLKDAFTLIFKSLLEIAKQLKGFKDIVGNDASNQGLLSSIFGNIQKQVPKEDNILEKAFDSKTWDKLGKDLEEGAKKAKDFFQKIFKSWD
jgi:uncharacterized protein involved in outer membrane biogenesis